MSLPVSYASLAPTSFPGLMAEAKSARASSLVKISKALAMPAISSSRMLLRMVHSSCFASQAFFVSSKKTMSASFCAAVSSYICCVSARRTSDSAFSSSFFALSSSISFNSMAFTAMKSSNFVLAAASSRVDDSKSEAKVSYMSANMPWTVADCGVYLPCDACCRKALNCATLSALRPAVAGSDAITDLRAAVACVFACNSAAPCLGFVAATSTVTACSKAAKACFISVVSAV
mmetsp:Transcript_14426/g.33083  ORF Transcript_14426/g.33083 Transcript_14426/m.33083 type:complete len:233 (+) Transcript_14426:227-925(+)